MAPLAIAGFVMAASGSYLLIAAVGAQWGFIDLRHPPSLWMYGLLLVILGGVFLYLLFGGMKRLVRWQLRKDSNERATRATAIRDRAHRNSLGLLHEEFGEYKEPKIL
jgi:hypothetical protein